MIFFHYCFSYNRCIM